MDLDKVRVLILLYVKNEGFKFIVLYSHYHQDYHQYHHDHHHHHHHPHHDHHHHHHHHYYNHHQHHHNHQQQHDDYYILGLEIIHKNQHPEDCSNAKYIISGGRYDY